MILMTSGRFIEWLSSSISAIFRSRVWFMVFMVEETGVLGQTLSHNIVSSTTLHERDSTSQLQW